MGNDIHRFFILGTQNMYLSACFPIYNSYIHVHCQRTATPLIIAAQYTNNNIKRKAFALRQ